MMLNRLLLLLSIFLFPLFAFSQADTILKPDTVRMPPVIDYASAQDYEIGGVTISGILYYDNNALIGLSGLAVGDRIKIPGENITKAVKKLWDQGFFGTVSISATKILGDKVFLNIHLTERPRLSFFNFKGVTKGEIDEIRKEISLEAGDIIDDHVLIRSKNIIRNNFTKKGFLDVSCEIVQRKDTTRENAISLTFNINKNSKVRINQVKIRDSKGEKSDVVRPKLKKTKERGMLRPFQLLDSLLTNIPLHYLKKDPREPKAIVTAAVNAAVKTNFFKSSKFIKEDYEEDKLGIIEKYNEMGYRDAYIVKDSIYKVAPGEVNIDIVIDEGRKYYFGNIVFVGNTKYSSKVLNEILRIKKGDIYNQATLMENLTSSPDGMDISTLYLDDGYLFFQVDPVEVRVENDSIDLEIRVREGKQARINKILVKGNTKTNDHVIYREMRTRPGQLFSKTDIVRTVRELAQLKYFDAQKLVPVPKPNPVDGTVDIEYNVEETSSDQIELSGGWGYGRIVGSLGLSFNNFSLKNVLKPEAWKPVPSGDGQKLGVRFQSYGKGYFSYNLSFTEPWLGGKKPTALQVAYWHSKYSNGLPQNSPSYYSYITDGATVSLSKRLKWPDDFFAISHAFTFQRYKINNYRSILDIRDGNFYNFNYGLTISRSSIDQPLYPKSGSELVLTMNFTPPYSLLNGKNYDLMTPQEKYQWVEFHKYKFSAAFYTKLFGDFVLLTRVKYGFLARYNKDLLITPFNRFYMGGDGLSGYNSIDGREVIGMRGYMNETLTPDYWATPIGGTIYNKMTMELRFPVSLNPNSTIYMLGFFEAGNDWRNFEQFDPFNLYRAAGVGIRVFLPMFGTLGLDWGYGMDEVPGIPGANGSQFHFSINSSID
jgi:outer membrane protein insertion porin family